MAAHHESASPAPSAAPGPTEHRLIPGLYTWSAPAGQMAAVAAELHGAFDTLKTRGPETGSRHGRRRMSDAIELGVSFNRMEKDAPVFCMERATGSRNFASTLGLIAEQTAAYREHVEGATGTKTTQDNDHHLNVVIRRYRPGQSIGFHIDRLEKFEDAVWNVVVENSDSSGGLQYQVDDSTKVPVNESPGLVSVQTGPARHTFKHGVPTVSTERISITWRWFRPEFLTSLDDYSEAEARAVLSPFVNRVQQTLANGNGDRNHNQNRNREFSSDSSDSDNADSGTGFKATAAVATAAATTTVNLMATAMPPLPPTAKHDWSLFGMAEHSADIKLPPAPTGSCTTGLWKQPAVLAESSAVPTLTPTPARSTSSRVRTRKEMHESWATRPRVGIISSSAGIIGQDSSKGKDHITRFW
uniref:Fe2OG dioxygenase domain-containing protein n=1 Tax=Florenciella parvula TaxID=236787 RepID=A0A7S2B5B5_9STRA